MTLCVHAYESCIGDGIGDCDSQADLLHLSTNASADESATYATSKDANLRSTDDVYRL